MANLASVLKDEIRRLARKEIKSEVSTLKGSSAQYRRDIAALKRTNAELARKVAHLERALRKAEAQRPATTSGRSVRFSQDWLIKHREKIGLTQAQYAQLVGVSAMTIYNWEAGNTRPRDELLASWGAVHKLGRREALRKLEQG